MKKLTTVLMFASAFMFSGNCISATKDCQIAVTKTQSELRLKRTELQTNNDIAFCTTIQRKAHHATENEIMEPLFKNFETRNVSIMWLLPLMLS